ncbi:uncharacterized protein LOC121760386 [Salvia splendens]|uniref:uncharacterized protein LOC121760386 n=1 Tax=Salvia splendens TaxID=180675 RepID=UPI001C25BDD7|nr:uncharacterized protein LOC121760386 [Salvia splendens]
MGRNGPKRVLEINPRLHLKKKDTPRHFLKQNPPQFDGLEEPPKVEAWIRALERIFDFMECTDKKRLACVTFQLTGHADFWWDTKRRTMNPARREALTWNEFKEEVYNKYIPMRYSQAKIVEFHTLKQGSMTVTEYDRALCEMTRYAPELVDTDEKMAENFHSGLRHEIRVAVASHRGVTYSEILSCALDVEEALPKDETVANPTPPTPQQQHNSRDKRKWDGDQTPYENKRKQHIQTAPNQRGNFRPRIPPCTICSRNHRGECRLKFDGCYNCGGTDHFSRDCPSKNVGVDARQNDQGPRPQLQAIQVDPREDPAPPPNQ